MLVVGRLHQALGAELAGVHGKNPQRNETDQQEQGNQLGFHVDDFKLSHLFDDSKLSHLSSTVSVGWHEYQDLG